MSLTKNTKNVEVIYASNGGTLNKRNMGYPDSYKICENPSQAYQQFGNSVVIDVLQYIACQIANVVKQ